LQGLRLSAMKLRGIAQLTPRIDTSTCPPRIIPKDSAESKTDAPGTSVTVSLPALMISLNY
jgi:hypothetical protein